MDVQARPLHLTSDLGGSIERALEHTPRAPPGGPHEPRRTAPPTEPPCRRLPSPNRSSSTRETRLPSWRLVNGDECSKRGGNRVSLGRLCRACLALCMRQLHIPSKRVSHPLWLWLRHVRPVSLRPSPRGHLLSSSSRSLGSLPLRPFQLVLCYINLVCRWDSNVQNMTQHQQPQRQAGRQALPWRIIDGERGTRLSKNI